MRAGRAVRIDEASERATVPGAEKLGNRDVMLDVQSVGSGKAGARRDAVAVAARGRVPDGARDSGIGAVGRF